MAKHSANEVSSVHWPGRKRNGPPPTMSSISSNEPGDSNSSVVPSASPAANPNRQPRNRSRSAASLTRRLPGRFGPVADVGPLLLCLWRAGAAVRFLHSPDASTQRIWAGMPRLGTVSPAAKSATAFSATLSPGRSEGICVAEARVQVPSYAKALWPCSGRPAARRPACSLGNLGASAAFLLITQAIHNREPVKS